MISFFDAVTAFQIMMILSLAAGLAYGRRRGRLPVRAAVLHNAMYLVWALVVTAFFAASLAVWAVSFFVLFFLSHALCGRRRQGAWINTERVVHVRSGAFLFLPAAALLFGGMQVLAYYLPLCVYALPYEIGTAAAGGLFLGLLFSYTDRELQV